jgi:oligosaccharyltransferase complex subunit beta
LIDAPVVVGTRNVAPLLYKGTGLVADRENPLVLQLLTASSSAYSYVPEQPVKEVNIVEHYSILHKFLMKLY